MDNSTTDDFFDPANITQESVRTTAFTLDAYHTYENTRELHRWYGNKPESFEEYFEIEYRNNPQKFSSEGWRTVIIHNLSNFEACELIDNLKING